MAYQPAFDPFPQQPNQIALPFDAPLDRTGISKTEIVEGFQFALNEKRGEEIARGLTTVGPHRDELRFLANGIDWELTVRAAKSAPTMLAIKMAEVAWMKEKTGHWPVLLLDEVLAELDPQRRTDLLDSSCSRPNRPCLPPPTLTCLPKEFVQSAQQWHIHGGTLQAAISPPAPEQAYEKWLIWRINPLP